MNLIVCFTPLQVLIAMKAIAKENIDYNNIRFLYFSTIKDKRHIKYYNLISELAKSSMFITELYSIRLLYKLKKELSDSFYNQVLLGSIDDSITHYLLSYSKFNELITFDDGVGNILKCGSYFNEQPRKSLKKRFFTIIHRLLGRKYYLDNVKNKSARHYTIYDSFDNCVKNTVVIRLFEARHSMILDKHNVKNIVLGTMYDEAVIRNHAIELKKDLMRFMKHLTPEPYYLPHPRALDSEFKCFEINTGDIAEDYILKLLDQGFKINLYGFASSCQFNLLSIPDVKIYLFSSDRLKPAMKDAMGMLVDVIPNENVISI